jgi:hypothetical protein
VVLPKSLDLSVKLWIAAAGLSLPRGILSVVNTNAIVDETAARLGAGPDAARGSVAGIGSVIFSLLLIAGAILYQFKLDANQYFVRR